MTDKTMIKAFIKAQAEMGKALKDSNNPHFKSKYADLSSVMGATLPALNDNGFAMMQIDGKDDMGHFVKTVFQHESGEGMESTIYLVIDKQNMQGYGSAQTYARRYGLMGLAGIAPEDDDGNAASTKTAPAKITADQFVALTAKIDEAGVDAVKIAGAYGVGSIEEMNADDVPKAMHRLSLTIKANASGGNEQTADDAKFLEGK